MIDQSKKKKEEEKKKKKMDGWRNGGMEGWIEELWDGGMEGWKK